MNKILAKEAIKSFLIEDIGTGDLSTDLVFDTELRASGNFVAKDDGVVCGTEIIDMVYSFFSDDYNITLLKKDGESVKKGEIIATVEARVATMLSGESANGKYPLESVTTMATIDKNAQTLLNEYGRLNSDSFERNSKTEVMASAVKDATNSMDIKLVVTLTKTGHTARLISKYRPDADILALTFDELTERGLMLNWGVIPMLTEAPSSTDDMFEIAERKAVEAGLVKSGDDIVIVAGVPVGEAVRTNTMRIRTVR